MIASGRNPNGFPASHRSSTSAGSTCSAPDNAHRSDERSNSPGVACLRNRLANRLYAKFGADPAQFASTMASFTVNAKFGRAKQYIAQQRANSTPTIIVNGRYRIKARDFETMLENTDRVIAQVRAGG